jgi:hypothetical protein
MNVVILEDAAEDLESGAHSMNRARRELAITFLTQSSPILTLCHSLTDKLFSRRLSVYHRPVGHDMTHHG